MNQIRNAFAILAVTLLAGCATQPPEQPGRHLLVRDSAGQIMMQFDYPNDEMCAKTSRLMRAGSMKAGCSTAPAAEQLRSHATLRYNPPGVLVPAHYKDVAACRHMTRELAAGVEMSQACAAK